MEQPETIAKPQRRRVVLDDRDAFRTKGGSKRSVREQILQPERCGELYSQRLDSNVELIPHLGGEYDD